MRGREALRGLGAALLLALLLLGFGLLVATLANGSVRHDPTRGGPEKCGRVLVRDAIRRYPDPRPVPIPPGCTELRMPAPFRVRANTLGGLELWYRTRRLAALPAGPVAVPTTTRPPAVAAPVVPSHHATHAHNPGGFPRQQRTRLGGVEVLTFD